MSLTKYMSMETWWKNWHELTFCHCFIMVWTHPSSSYHVKLSFTSRKAIPYFHINSYCPITKHSQLWYDSSMTTIMDGWWVEWSWEMLSHVKPHSGHDVKEFPNSRLSLYWILNKDWQRLMVQHSPLVVSLNKYSYKSLIKLYTSIVTSQQARKHRITLTSIMNILCCWQKSLWRINI